MITKYIEAHIESRLHKIDPMMYTTAYILGVYMYVINLRKYSMPCDLSNAE